MIKGTDFAEIRKIGDPPADNIITQLIDTEGIGFVRELMPFLSDYQQLSFEKQPKILIDFLAKNSEFPYFFDKKQLIRATDFYRENQQNIGLVLGLYSLPYCYLGADGAKVLYLSERIRNDTFKRLLETGNFLKAVMSYDNWSDNKIFSICLKVRLLHAAIRNFTLKSNKWDLAWGYPINQEDMLGTNLAFSLIVLKGMAKLGFETNATYETAYLDTWNLIGFLLGINAEILPHNYPEAIKRDRLISQRQFRQSLEGQVLAESLMNTIRSFAPNETIANLLQEQARFLLGKNNAEMLGIKETNLPKSLLKLYTTTSVLLAKYF